MDSKTKPIWWDDKMESRFKNIWSEEYDGLLKEEIRNKIIHRCEILKYMGDDGVHPLYYQNYCETCKDERDNYMWGYEQDRDQDFVNSYIRNKGRKIIQKGFFENESNHGALTV